MQLMKEITMLLRKDMILEWRQKYAISGILLYVLSTVFIVYTASVEIKAPTWNILFWIIILFASVNANAKSFMQENSTRQLYYYSLVNPTAVIISKIIYNTVLLLVLSLLCFFVFGVIAGNPVKDVPMFLLILLLGSMGFSISFTFISAIAAKAHNSATLMTILSFPVVIPILMTLIKLSAIALRLIQDTSVWKDVLILVGIDFLLIGLCLILFPFLWRD